MCMCTPITFSHSLVHLIFGYGKSHLQIFRRFPSKVKSIVKVLALCANARFGKPSLFFHFLSLSFLRLVFSLFLSITRGTHRYYKIPDTFWVVHSHPCIPPNKTWIWIWWCIFSGIVVIKFVYGKISVEFKTKTKL